jgi:F-type H+-transporting ATPase subunit delta
MTAATGPDPELVAGTVFDESTGEVARNYADALLAALGDGAGPVLDELDEIVADVVRGQPRFAELMTGPTMALSDRDRVLVELFGGRAMPPVVNLLRVLNRHGRLGLLAPILALARDEWDRKQGRRPVTVRSAVPLDDAQRSALQGRLSKLIGATPVLTLEVDPSLIAGLVVQVGDDVYDASVRTRLRRLRDRLIERKSYVQI